MAHDSPFAVSPVLQNADDDRAQLMPMEHSRALSRDPFSSRALAVKTIEENTILLY